MSHTIRACFAGTMNFARFPPFSSTLSSQMESNVGFERMPPSHTNFRQTLPVLGPFSPICDDKRNIRMQIESLNNPQVPFNGLMLSNDATNSGNLMQSVPVQYWPDDKRLVQQQLQASAGFRYPMASVCTPSMNHRAAFQGQPFYMADNGPQARMYAPPTPFASCQTPRFSTGYNSRIYRPPGLSAIQIPANHGSRGLVRHPSAGTLVESDAQRRLPREQSVHSREGGQLSFEQVDTSYINASEPTSRSYSHVARACSTPVPQMLAVQSRQFHTDQVRISKSHVFLSFCGFVLKYTRHLLCIKTPLKHTQF